MSAVRGERNVALAFASIVVSVAVTAAVVAVLPARGASSPRRAHPKVGSPVESHSRPALPGCVPIAAWSPAAGLPCAPDPYRPGDFVYTCSWITSHPAEAADARVSCDTP